MSIIQSGDDTQPLSGTQLATFQRGLTALSAILVGTRAQESGRQSRDSLGVGALNSGMLTVVPPVDAEGTWRVLDLDLISLERVSPSRITEILADLSPEMSSGLNDWLRFVNPGFEITAFRRGTTTVDVRAQAALDEMLATLRANYGTLDVMINRLVMSGYLRGAYLAEAVFAKDGKTLVDIATPDPASIRFRRAIDPLRGEIFEMGQWQGGKFVVLDRPTIKYIPLDPFPGKPYGRPMVTPAIFLALFNIGLLRDIRRVVAQQGYPRLDLSIDLEKLFATLPPNLQTVDAFAEWAERQLRQVEAQYASVRPEDAYIHFSPVTVNRPVGALDASSLGAVDGLTKTIERGLARGLKTSPIILGLTENTSEAQANRQWEIHAARVKAAQHPLETLLVDLLTLGLEARGIQADVEASFAELRSAEYMRDEQVRQLKLTNADLAFKAGYIDLAAAAKYGFDVDELPAEQDRYQAPAPVAPAVPAAQMDPNAQANPEPGAQRVAWVQDGGEWRRLLLTFPDDRRRPRDARHNEPGSHPQGRDFASVADAHAWASATYGGWASNLDDDQRNAIDRYIQTSDGINGYLRSGGTPQADKGVAGDARHIDRAMAEAPPLPRQVVVYRGIDASMFDDLLDEGEKVGHGTTFRDFGYTSTTFDREVASGFAANAAGWGTPQFVRIIVPKGTRAAYLENLMESDDPAKGSYELLLPRGTKYRVVRSEKNPDAPGGRALVMEALTDE